MATNALLQYGESFYDRSREPIGGNSLNIRWGDLLPYYGNALSYDDARRDYEQGNYGQAALGAAMTAIPWGSLLRKGGNALKREMVAYHGTPHQFDEFKLDKIGTGEGAQVYGHGLYFAGNPRVAENYAKKLGGKELVVNGERVALEFGNPAKNAARTLLLESASSPNPFETAKAMRMGGFDSPEQHKQVVAAIDAFKAEGAALRDTGNLYKADIPEDHELLDWDAPLSKQSEGVRKAIAENTAHWQQKPPPDMKGGDFYQYVMGGDANASYSLGEWGIPGLKYLDQGSRGAGSGTHNYVVWDEGKIKHLGGAE